MIEIAAEIIQQWPGMAQEMLDPYQFHTRLHLPIRAGQMRIIPAGPARVMYTWTKLDLPCPGLYTADQWRNDGKFLWLVDLVYDRGVTARQATEAYREDMLDEGIAEDGEIMLFYRTAKNRYGHGTVRRRHTDGRRIQN